MSSFPQLMDRRRFPTGQASTAMLKALLRSSVVEKGRGAGEAWLRAIRMTPDDLEDESRMLPLPTLHRALLAFAALGLRDAIPGVTKYLIEPNVLGVWVRVLRGTTSPAEAFGRLDAADSEYGRTTRWETVAMRRGWWRGRVTIAHDPSLEDDGLLRLARLAELAAIPALFGWPNAAARARGEILPRGPTVVQEYEVTWSVPNTRASRAIGGVLGAAAGAIVLASPAARPLAAVIIVMAAAVGVLLGAVRAHDRQRRAETRAQAIRVLALERSLSLRESRDHEVPGQLEGTVAAGQYRIVRRMGSGATGVIYEAVRVADGVPVAVKLLRAAAAHETVASDRLRREAEALGLAWHPNVVEVIDQGHLPDGTAYLAMELLHGESLAARLRTKGRLRYDELLPIAMQVCDALAAVHAAGVVHRDVKPSNIFLAAESANLAHAERVKLLDFGIARVEWEETRITNTGGPLGTPGYMSPEQEMGTGEVDGRSDLFALGAVLYECLVGEPPPPQSPSGLVRTADTEVLRFDSGRLRACAAVAPAWYAVIEKALAPNPADRYQDARSFLQALREVRDDLAHSG
jgi:eukaryotic-like serine/threonine-protein kinase